MTIASRTPEGVPGRCPICGATTRVDPSEPLDDAPCPVCGALLTWLRERHGTDANVALLAEMAADPDSVAADLGADSVDVIEFVMAMEDWFGISVPDHEYEKIRSMRDAIEVIRRLLNDRR